jgi:SAM-dependent methyltransferase
MHRFDLGAARRDNAAMADRIALFDPKLVLAHRRRALGRSLEGVDFLLKAAIDDLVDRLAAVKRQFATAVDLGTPLALLAARLASSGRVGSIARLDPLADASSSDGHVIAGDMEALPFRDGSLDLVVSALALHWINDLPGLLAQIRRALRPDGLFLANLLGGETLNELRESLTAAEAEIAGGASPRVAPFAELRDLGALLQRAGFALPVIDQDRLTVRYADALELMRDLRAMGAANALSERSRRPLRRDVLFRAAAIYAERFADADGRIRATFDIVSLSGWAPDESQQKPLRPGSARMRLADALGTVEKSTGEKPGK